MPKATKTHTTEMQARKLRRATRKSDMDIVAGVDRRDYRASRVLTFTLPNSNPPVKASRPIGAQPFFFVGKKYAPNGKRERARRIAVISRAGA